MFDRVPVIIQKSRKAGVYCSEGPDKFQKKLPDICINYTAFAPDCQVLVTNGGGYTLKIRADTLRRRISRYLLL